jgi:hypothetical protein
MAVDAARGRRGCCSCCWACAAPCPCARGSYTWRPARLASLGATALPTSPLACCCCAPAKWRMSRFRGVPSHGALSPQRNLIALQSAEPRAERSRAAFHNPAMPFVVGNAGSLTAAGVHGRPDVSTGRCGQPQWRGITAADPCASASHPPPLLGGCGGSRQHQRPAGTVRNRGIHRRGKHVDDPPALL